MCREDEIHQVQKIDRIDHKMQRSLKLPQVQYINKVIQKVQQITEVTQQQYMNVDVPAEIQCMNTATHQNTVTDAQVQRQVQMLQKMPSDADIQNMLMPGSSGAAVRSRSSTSHLEQMTDEFVQSPGPVLQISSRRA